MSSTSTRPPTPEVPGAGHLLAEEAPEGMVAALTEFLAPYSECRGDSR
jgi:hypothetical protein